MEADTKISYLTIFYKGLQSFLNKHIILSFQLTLIKILPNHHPYCIILRSMRFYPVETVMGIKAKNHKRINILVQLCAW